MSTQAPARAPQKHASGLPRLQITFAAPRDSRAEAWLRGATPDEAITRVGLAYSICRHAQQTAAQLAMRAAGASPCHPDEQPPTRRVQNEWLREHACNLMLAWPGLLGQAGEPALIRSLMHTADDAAAQQAALTDILTRDVLGMAPDVFLAMDACALEAWCADAATATAARFRVWQQGPACPGMTLLPALSGWDTATANALAGHMRNEPDFCLRPHWHGQAVEAGAYARQHAHPLLRAWRRSCGNNPAARMLARLIELATAATGPSAATILRAWALGADEAIAAVETARGPLLHHVRLRQGRIEDYHVLAPTEWNFHPHGLLAQAAIACDRDHTAQCIQAWVLALDPCESCRVEVLRA